MQHWRIQRVGAMGVAAPPPTGSIFSQKAAIFRVKGLYVVVCICDKWGRSW